MPEFIRKFLVLILLLAFILIVVLISHYFLEELHDANYHLICYSYYHGKSSPFPFFTGKIVPLVSAVFYIAVIITCSLGLIIGMHGLKTAEIRSLQLMSIIILLSLLILTANQLRLYLTGSCPA